MSPIKTKKGNRNRWLETKSEQERKCHESLHGMPRYEAELMWTGRAQPASWLFMAHIHCDWRLLLLFQLQVQVASNLQNFSVDRTRWGIELRPTLHTGGQSLLCVIAGH